MSSFRSMEWTKNLKLAGKNYYSGVVDDVEDILEQHKRYFQHSYFSEVCKGKSATWKFIFKGRLAFSCL